MDDIEINGAGSKEEPPVDDLRDQNAIDEANKEVGWIMILNNDFIYFLIFCLINEKVGIEDMLKFEPLKYGMLRALVSVKMRKTWL